MRTAIVLAACALLMACSGQPEAPEDPADVNKADGRLWVTSQYLDRHTCPDEACGTVGRLFLREGVDPLEQRDGWVRITKSYDASCQGGASAYVDEGNASCEPANGIENGHFAEWVKADGLSSTRPADPAESASNAEKLVAKSDDFTQHRTAFVKAADELITSGRCSKGDFVESGGWWKSTNHRDEPVYFIYCGGNTTDNRLYLDASSGRIFP